VQRVFPVLFFAALFVCVFGAASGRIIYGSPAFRIASAAVMLSLASWSGVNGVGLAWGLMIGLTRKADGRLSVPKGTLVLVGATAALFLAATCVFAWAALTPWLQE